MLQEIGDLVVQTYRTPREAARSIIARLTRFEDIAVVFFLSFCLSGVLQIITTLAIGVEVDGGFLIDAISNLLFSALAFLTIVFLVVWIGRMFGGNGDLMTISAVIAWHSLMTVIFAPFLTFTLLSPDPGGGAAFIQLILGIVVVWLFVNFITEAHGFKSAWTVAFVFLGGMFFAGILLGFIAAGLTSTS